MLKDRIELVEKGARALLWLALAAAVLIAALAYDDQVQLQEAGAQAARRAAEAKAKSAAVPSDQPVRLHIDSLRPVMSGLVVPQSIGKLWFTNASARSGVVCVRGHAVNEKTNQSVRSLSACARVEPYASAVTLELRFAGRELDPICPDANACRLAIEEAPDPPAQPSK